MSGKSRNDRIEHVERKHVEIGREWRVCEPDPKQHKEGHGPYEAIRWELQPQHVAAPPFWGNCPTCDAIWQKEADEHDAAIRDGTTAKQRAAAERRILAGIPERYHDSTVWNWQHKMDQQGRVWNWAREYANAFDLAIQTGRCGVFCGAPGTGKTHLAIGLLWHVIEKGCSGHYTTVMGMLSRIKNTYHREAQETEASVVNYLKSVDLLVIDEVGRQLDTNYETAQLFRLLDLRYAHLRPVILVSNLNKTDLVKFLGDSVCDRLRESGGAMLVFDWASQRSRAKKEREREEEA